MKSKNAFSASVASRAPRASGTGLGGLTAGVVRANRQVQPAGGASGLAVQVGEPGQVQERLKAERVQERLRAMPGWRLVQDGRAIDRVRQFPTPGVASAYAAFASALAGSHQQPIAIALSAGQVVLTLSGHPRRGAAGGLTEPVLDLAASLG